MPAPMTTTSAATIEPIVRIVVCVDVVAPGDLLLESRMLRAHTP
jgi:hypothetical protein